MVLNDEPLTPPRFCRSQSEVWKTMLQETLDPPSRLKERHKNDFNHRGLIFDTGKTGSLQLGLRSYVTLTVGCDFNKQSKL